MLNGIGKQVTLKDVAKASGVSHQTVSRVVNNHPYVSAITRQRVINVMRELNYRPNKAARSLVTRRTNTIGIISFGTDYYGPAQAVANIERAVRRRGYALITLSIAEMTFKALREGISDLQRHQIDGLVLMTPIRDVALERLSQICNDTPFVILDIEIGTKLPSVVFDQREGARMAVEFLIANGHSAIAEIHGPLDWVDAQLRHKGFLETLERVGLAPAATAGGTWTAQSGYDAATRLLRNESFSAVFSHNDQMALGALRAFHENEIKVPEEISLVGFDDIPEASFFEPPLTTVRQDFLMLGEQSVDYLISLVELAIPSFHQHVLRPSLVERQSVSKMKR